MKRPLTLAEKFEEIRKNGVDEPMEKFYDRITTVLRTAEAEIRADERRRIAEWAKGKRLPSHPKPYDGSKVQTAADYYGIAAQDWAEIIRYEQGYNRGIGDVLAFLIQKRPYHK